ncbi:MAG: glycosyltransferase family A protein [Paracoccaceae bacterium]
MTKPEAVHRLAIGAITRQRPELFGEMLESLALLEWPKNIVPSFIFVENDEHLSISNQINEFRKKMPGSEIHIDVEPTLGIPFARNRVLDLALTNEFDYLAFLDDDELAPSDWIAKIYLRAQQHDLDLIGGPLELVPPENKLLHIQRLCWDFLVEKNARRRTSADEKVDRGEEGAVRIFTNNWLVRLNFVRDSGLRFDETLGLSGGSDTRFYVQSKELGAKTGWHSKAIVQDRIPLSRLTFSYQFKRARDQNLALYFIDGRNKRPFARLRTTVSFVGRSIRGSIRFIFAMLRGGRGSVEALTLIGVGLGRLYAAFGIRSSHYKNITDADS